MGYEPFVDYFIFDNDDVICCSDDEGFKMLSYRCRGTWGVCTRPVRLQHSIHSCSSGDRFPQLPTAFPTLPHIPLACAEGGSGVCPCLHPLQTQVSMCVCGSIHPAVQLVGPWVTTGAAVLFHFSSLNGGSAGGLRCSLA